MAGIVIVGSGASGVHFALTVLKKGHDVLMLDVGRQGPEPVLPSDDFTALKAKLDDPAGYFLGPRYEALVLPDRSSEYYGFPPNKQYIFASANGLGVRARGFAPLLSFARGGLAEAWTGGCYPFNDSEMETFPFRYEGLKPFYVEVARRIGITGIEDDLAPFLPLHDGLLEPLRLDRHSRLLLDRYQSARRALNEKHACFIGRSRIAVLSRDLGDRKRCDYLGRCLWGCPSRSLYTPSITLEECRKFRNFRYVPGVYVSHFRYSSGGRITALAVDEIATGKTSELPVETLVLAAGTLCSSKIFLESVRRDSGEILELRGLMDNRQILMPFVNLRMLGQPHEAQSYQYHQVAVAVAPGPARDYIHGLVTTLKTALIHPIVESFPFDLGTGVRFFRQMHAALGLVNINLADHRRDENYLTLETAGQESKLAIHYQPDAGEPERLRRATATFRKVLWKLGCVAPPQMTHLRPMGASVHYAGTLPMSATSGRLACSPLCRSYDFDNLYFADGTSFPWLPAKNLTFTLMANAIRVAQEAF